MKVADLRHILHIQNPTTTQNDRGAVIPGWTTSAQLRGKVRTVSGDERNTDEQIIPIAAHEVVIRWPLPTGTTLTTKSRVRWTVEGAYRYFGVTAIGEPDNRRRLVALTCQELVGEERGL